MRLACGSAGYDIAGPDAPDGRRSAGAKLKGPSKGRRAVTGQVVGQRQLRLTRATPQAGKKRQPQRANAAGQLVGQLQAALCATAGRCRHSRRGRRRSPRSTVNCLFPHRSFLLNRWMLTRCTSALHRWARACRREPCWAALEGWGREDVGQGRSDTTQLFGVRHPYLDCDWSFDDSRPPGRWGAGDSAGCAASAVASAAETAGLGDSGWAGLGAGSPASGAEAGAAAAFFSSSGLGAEPPCPRPSEAPAACALADAAPAEGWAGAPLAGLPPSMRATAFAAAPKSSSPPVAVFPASAGSGSTVSRSSCRICALLSAPPDRPLRTAAAPATNGAAALVPLM